MNKEAIKVGQLGFVRLIDTMGDDAAIVQAARVSYGAGTKTVSDDRNLIRYLMRHKHTSPLEMCEIKLHIKAPIHVMRQWIRHRTANVNEVSTRYSEVQNEFELFDLLRLQSTDNKQGSFGFLNGEKSYWLSEEANFSIKDSYETYNQLLEAGVAREQARNVLPLATYTECYWKIDLHNLFHFLRLRLHSHAQQEIREFAEAIYSIVKEWCPIATEAFEDYHLNACTFSKQEMDLIKLLAQYKPLYKEYSMAEIISGYPQMTFSCEENLLLKEKQEEEHIKRIDEFIAQYIPNKRERQEFKDKIGIK